MKVELLMPFLSDDWRGIERYAQLLLKGVEKYSAGDNLHLHRPSEELNRFGKFVGRRVLYPRSLQIDSQKIYHVADQSYSNLIHVLPKERSLITCHDLEFWRRRNFKNHLVRKSLLVNLSKFARVVCPSQSTADELSTLLQIPKEKIRVIPNPVMEVFTPPAQPKRNAKKILLHVGDLRMPRKNFEFLIHILFELKKRRQDFKFIQIGAAWTPSQKAKIEALGLSSFVEKKEKVTDEELVQNYQQADLFLFPSTYEGFGFPLVEAASCGLPLIASRISCFEEVLRSHPEFLLPLKTEIWLREIEKYFDHPEEGRVLASQLLQWASQYQLKNVIQSYLKVYHELAG